MIAGQGTRLNWRLISALIVAGGVLLFVGANAHLVYVAVASQPDCVPHEKTRDEKAGGTAATYRAARSAC